MLSFLGRGSDIPITLITLVCKSEIVLEDLELHIHSKRFHLPCHVHLAYLCRDNTGASLGAEFFYPALFSSSSSLG